MLTEQTSTQAGYGLVKHHLQMHAMVSDRSSRAHIWTDVRKNSMHAFLFREDTPITQPFPIY